jgi:hypothetical protein
MHAYVDETMYISIRSYIINDELRLSLADHVTLVQPLL